MRASESDSPTAACWISSGILGGAPGPLARSALNAQQLVVAGAHDLHLGGRTWRLGVEDHDVTYAHFRVFTPCFAPSLHMRL